MSPLGRLEHSSHSCDKYVLSSYSKPSAVLGARAGGSMERREGGEKDMVFVSRIFQSGCRDTSVERDESHITQSQG